MLAIPAHPQMHAHGGAVAADAMRTVSSIMRLLVALLWGVNDVFAEAPVRHMATMDTLAALGWSICATYWCGCSITGQGAGTAGSSASKSGENENCPIALFFESRLSAIQVTAWHLF
jgi:hypothetical protein